jgi:hypothetical protein
MKKVLKTIASAIFVLIILTGIFGLFVKLLQIGFFPDTRYFILVCRSIVVIIILPIASSMLWLGLALILKVTLDKLSEGKK